MKKAKATHKPRTSRTVIFVPERKISETILEFAQPILDPLGPDVEAARKALEIVMAVWNFHTMATPLWGKPQFLADARARMCGPTSAPGLSVLFESLVERKATDYGNDYRVVGDWSLTSDDSGHYSLRCEARLPHGCEPYVPPAAETRIAIGGRYLDEVKIHQTKTALLSYPVARHHAASEGERVTIDTPSYVAVQLFADGTLPAIGGPPVKVSTFGKPAREMVLVEVRTSPKAVGGDGVSLVFAPRAGS